MRKGILIYSVFISLLAFARCHNIKHLPVDDNLYVGADIQVHSKDPVDQKKIKTELAKIPRPVPNDKILGWRWKLSAYNYAGENPKGPIKKFLKKKVSQKPVLLSEVNPTNIADIMVNRLNSLGYFDAQVSYQVTIKKRKASVAYTAKVTSPYLLGKLIYPEDSSILTKRILESEQETFIKEGMQYDLNLFKSERERIDNYLKNNGFYYFNPDYLLFKADSTAGQKLVTLALTVKQDIPLKARTPYQINRVYINPGYQLNSDTSKLIPDTVTIDGFYYIHKDNAFKPSAVLRSVFLKKGDLYSRKLYSLTVNRLVGMGVFRNTAIKFTDTLVNGQGKLDTYINLTPLPKKSLQLDLEAVTKSNNYTGPAVTVSFKNRNLFRGAELFLFNLNGNFETQFSGPQKGFNSYEFGANTQLYFPKFLSPFTIKNLSTIFVPKTKIDLGFRLLNRVLYFKMAAFNVSYGYIWKESAQKEYEATPISINFARLLSTTTAFEDLLVQNPFLEKSFEEQFTIGGKYAFTYNSLVGLPKKNQYYFNVTLDVSGNTANAIQSLLKGKKPTEQNPNMILNYRYSQYTKLSTDFRYYLNFNKNSKLATRLIAGAGIPYGNSSTMPYIKQFFSGGSNSIRAFLPRTVGPGSYVTPDSQAGSFLDKSGDIKLEGNVEYRFTIISIIKGAVFVDAGNIWLSRKNELLPNGEFNPNRFYKEIAVGTGFGIRADVSFFVIRLDLGMPLRRPSLPEGERWVYNNINFGDGAWRKQNLVLNIAIGYPF